MKELVILTNKDDYPEKDLLRNLLRWRFSQHLTKGIPAQ
jgi:hypothetical protein